MGYYPSGKEEIEEELRQLRIDRNHKYVCKKCGEYHNKGRCPNCNSRSKKDNTDLW